MNTQFCFFESHASQKSISFGIKPETSWQQHEGQFSIISFFSIYFIIGTEPDFVNFCFIY